MPEVVYVGPSKSGVEIAETGQFAERGKPVEVSADLAKRLLQQPDNWEAAKPSSTRKADD